MIPKLEKDLSDFKSTIEEHLNERDSKMANVKEELENKITKNSEGISESIKKELNDKIVENSQSIKQ